MSLKTKLLLSSCGPLLILLVVGLISIRTITESSKTLDLIFRENYNSVAACLSMQQAIQEIERSAEANLWEGGSEPANIDSAILKFTRHLKFQRGNVTHWGTEDWHLRLAARRYRASRACTRKRP